jgi:hypothetical protein
MRAAAIPLSVAFELASVVAFAQNPTDAMAQLRDCSVMERAERLKCLDTLSQNIAPPAPHSEANDWVISETTSPVDYKPIVTANAVSVPDGSMQLGIYCRNGRTELVVTAPALTGREKTYILSYSINGRPPVKFATPPSLSGTGAPFPGDVARWLESLPDRGKLVIRLSSRSGTGLDGSFALDGLKLVRDQIASECNWPQAVASPQSDRLSGS